MITWTLLLLLWRGGSTTAPDQYRIERIATKEDCEESAQKFCENATHVYCTWTCSRVRDREKAPPPPSPEKDAG